MKLYTVGGNLATLRSKALMYNNPYNPLDLPPGTIRVRTSDGKRPSKYSYTTYDTATLVPGTTDVYDVYKSGTSLNRVLRDSQNVVEVIGANTSNITDMSEMFYSCGYLASVPLFDTSSVANMASMFQYCSHLASIPLFDTSNVTNMINMFYSCTSLTTVPLFDTSNVTTMGGMFEYCTSLTTVPLFDTSNVSNISWMFYECTSLTSVPLFDTSSVTNMDCMFYGCRYLTSIPLFDTSSVTIMSNMFYNCWNVQSGALALYQQASTKTTLPRHNRTFYNCGTYTTTGAAELAQIPSDWK